LIECVRRFGLGRRVPWQALVDPELSDTLMHLSGYIFRAAINAAIRKG